jgi:hypothetical protein
MMSAEHSRGTGSAGLVNILSLDDIPESIEAAEDPILLLWPPEDS